MYISMYLGPFNIGSLGFFNTGSLSFAGASNCELPASWTGRWFESGEREAVSVRGNNITHKGECVYQKGDKYIFKDE
jgi:hypothetical protein